MTSSNSKKKGKKKASPPAKKSSGGGDVVGGGAKKKKVAKKKTPLEELNDHAGKTKAKLQKEFIQAGPNNIVSCKISYSNQLVTIEGMGEGKTKKLSQQQAATNILHQLRERGLSDAPSTSAAAAAAQIMITPREKKSGGDAGVDTKKKRAKKKSSTSPSGSSIDATTSATASTAQSVVILMTPRENNFNEKTWWMVDINPVGGDDTSSSQGASTLVKRCMRTYGWDEMKTKKILNAYRQFITFKKEAQDWDAQILSPCYLVDQMWQYHILDVVNYCHDMMLLCGRVVGHDPDGALDYVAKQKRDETTRELLQKKFGSYDEDLWDYSPDKTHMKSEENIDSVDEGEVDTEMTMNTTGTEMISIWVNYQNRDGTLFKLKRTTNLGKVFEAYAVKKGVDVHTLGFFLDGKRISVSDTPEALGLVDNCLVDNCQIDVVYEQTVYPENVKSEG
jgi:small ubiquitin-related modifier